MGALVRTFCLNESCYIVESTCDLCRLDRLESALLVPDAEGPVVELKLN